MSAYGQLVKYNRIGWYHNKKKTATFGDKKEAVKSVFILQLAARNV